MKQREQNPDCAHLPIYHSDEGAAGGHKNDYLQIWLKWYTPC